MSKIKITIQTLKGAKYDMEVKESDTIQEVKNRVESDLDLGDAASMKLIHAGKILKDTQTIEQCKIKPNDFLVVMVSAKSKKPAAPKAPSGGAPSTTPAAGSASTPAAAAPAPGPATSPAAASTPAAAPTSPPAAAPAASPSGAPAGTGATFQTAASTVVMGSELESTVVNLMALGYEHSKVVAALRAAFNNPDRAAEYLMSGIPEEKLLQMAAAGGGGGGAPRGPAAGPASGGARAPAGGAPAPAASGTAPSATGATGPAAGGAPAAAGGGGGVPPGLEQFAASPEFAQLRTLLQTNPQLLQLLLAQVAQSNPQLMQAMGQNPQALMAMLGGMGGAGGAGGAGGGAPGGGALPPGMTAQQAAALAAQQRGGTVISITQEEKNSIDNLERLGFSRQKALEAFLACDRNEELAANYLFEHSGMDETDDLGGDDAGTGH